MYNFPSYDRNATKKIENLVRKLKPKVKDHAVSYRINDLEKMIHTLQEDFAHCFHSNLKNPSSKTTAYYEYYEFSRFKKLSEEAYRTYKALTESNMSYIYDEDYGSKERFNELMKRKFTVSSIPYYKVSYSNRLCFYTVEHHRSKILLENEKLTYEQMLSQIPKTLVMMEFDILAAEIYKLKYKYPQNDALQTEISQILNKVNQCKLSFKQTGQFDKTILENIHQNLSIISQHRGIHNRETHPIFNKILDSLRSIMNNITEFVTRPMQYCLPTTRKNMINFFSEPKTNTQKTIEHFVKEADIFMDQANKLNLG